MLEIVFFSIFAGVALTFYIVVPFIANRVQQANQNQRQRFTNNVEQLMNQNEAKKIGQLFIFAPMIMASIFYLFSPEELVVFAVVMGLIVGLILPTIYIRFLRQQTKNKFNDQLVDALMIMSSSFRGGLSLVQAMEAVVDEMPEPISKEFAVVLGENKMGVTIEEAMNHLYNRMKSIHLQQMITAILLARETGGNLPVIFQRIVNNIRENKKIMDNIKTLTLQGRIQGVVLSMLPIIFFFFVNSANPDHFKLFFEDELGKKALMAAVGCWAIGTFFIWRLSKLKDF